MVSDTFWNMAEGFFGLADEPTLGNEMNQRECDVPIQGWVECVGCADRSAYDLSQHTKATGVSLVAVRHLAQPKTVDVVRVESNKGVVGKAFKKEAKDVMDHLAKMEPAAVGEVEATLAKLGHFDLQLNGATYRLTPDMIQVPTSLIHFPSRVFQSVPTLFTGPTGFRSIVSGLFFCWFL